MKEAKNVTLDENIIVITQQEADNQGRSFSGMVNEILKKFFTKKEGNGSKEKKEP